MNDSPTRLIVISPNDATKLEQIYSKPSVKYDCPIGVDEPQLLKEWENDPFERRRITDPIWSPSLHKIQRIVVGKNPLMLILYYLDESGPQRPFVREQLMHIKEEPMLPPSLFEKQAATILTIYALKKFQEQLLQSSCYKCEEIPPDRFNSINQSLQIFLVTRFGSSNPNESEMIQIYQSFYKHKPLHDLQDQLIIEQPQLEQDYKYKLNRTIWKLQRFVNQKPETAIIFDETITLLLNAQIAATIENCNGQIINNNDIIKIPQNVKPKGSVRSNKRKKSGIEINSQRKKSKKLKEKDSNENKENIMIGNKGNSSSNDENINSITIPEICPYCDEKLPSPLPNKLKDLKAIKQFEFCHAYIGEMQIIPDGIKKGYSTVIDFNSISKRIENFSTDLLDICKKKVKSFYRDNFMREYRDKGKNKINSPMSLMSRIESFQPGYYGPRGAIVIAETLRKLFIDTKILTKSLTIPQIPMEYLQEVLIPEAAVRLIQKIKT
ncbi:hypothetical protein RhiirC2_820458 [Rhizophagus irregularis]|uniref:Restriction of telomere capping protein 4 n=1 Tax=Rhizophagus irregularis TaxID=588596 RepID=A0A2N1NL70_9GLOM|nr:hypothetical protein RhiirC2_820458 [Rhizophagus irregularis]